jgi:uncharacterized protein (TIGR02145 family)
MSNVRDVRAISTTGKSVRVAKANVRYPATQITVSQAGISATEVQAALHELDGEIDTLGTTKANAANPVFTGNVVIPDGDAANEAVSKGQMDAALALKQDKADIDDIAPEVAFVKRATEANVQSNAFMQRVFEANKDLLSIADRIYTPEAGVKNTSGKAETLYDLSPNADDAVQATEGSRWYLGNLIAPNEKASLKGVTGQAATSIGFTDVTKLSTDSWSLVQNIKCNNVGEARIYYGSAYLAITATEIILHNGTGAVLTGTYATVSGENMTVECRYQAGNGVILVNRVAIPTTVGAVGITFGEITFNASYPFDGQHNYFGLYSDALSAFDSSRLVELLSTEFPPIETISVGSQQVATSNLEATVFDGVVIPEVQDNAAWAALTTPAWSHYDNSAANGAIYGKLFNGYAVMALAPYAPTGFHVPSALEWIQLSENLGGNTVSGGKLKALYGGFDNAFATNESGVSLLDGGQRLSAGVFQNLDIFGFFLNNDSKRRYIYALGTELYSSDIDYNYGGSLRLFSNTPHLTTNLYESGLFATDISSSAKVIRIPFGTRVKSTKCVTSTNVTAIEAKLFDYAGTELETLITGKACNATTKSFSVTADQTVSYTDNYVRVTATGNGGAGMNIIVTIEPI